jgi:hypothetical protein
MAQVCTSRFGDGVYEIDIQVFEIVSHLLYLVQTAGDILANMKTGSFSSTFSMRIQRRLIAAAL